jgi:hypothetical protein
MKEPKNEIRKTTSADFVPVTAMAGVNRAPRLFDLDPRIQRLLTLETFKVRINYENTLIYSRLNLGLIIHREMLAVLTLSRRSQLA